MLVMKYSLLFVITTISLLVVGSLGQQALGYGGPPEQSSAGKYTVEISFDKESYNLGDSIVFSGNVNKYDENRNLRISIFSSSSGFISTEKTSVNEDTTFFYTLLLNEKFADGKYVVKAQYGNSKAIVEKISFIIDSSKPVSLEQQSSVEAEIPDWIKSNAGWWAEGNIDDNSFIQGIFERRKKVQRNSDTTLL